MKTNIYFSLLLAFLLLQTPTWAGNPDRQGEAGAYELLLNPWARSAGLHTLNTSTISGVEAIRLNPAGLVRIQQLEVALSRANYLQGTGIGMNALGLFPLSRGNVGKETQRLVVGKLVVVVNNDAGLLVCCKRLL